MNALAKCVLKLRPRGVASDWHWQETDNRYNHTENYQPGMLTRCAQHQVTTWVQSAKGQMEKVCKDSRIEYHMTHVTRDESPKLLSRGNDGNLEYKWHDLEDGWLEPFAL